LPLLLGRAALTCWAASAAQGCAAFGLAAALGCVKAVLCFACWSWLPPA